MEGNRSNHGSIGYLHKLREVEFYKEIPKSDLKNIIQGHCNDTRERYPEVKAAVYHP